MNYHVTLQMLAWVAKRLQVLKTMYMHVYLIANMFTPQKTFNMKSNISLFQKLIVLNVAVQYLNFV